MCVTGGKTSPSAVGINREFEKCKPRCSHWTDPNSGCCVIGVEGITVTEVRSHVLQKIGDRKIFVNSIEEAVRIRNGDREENVL